MDPERYPLQLTKLVNIRTEGSRPPSGFTEVNDSKNVREGPESQISDCYETVLKDVRTDQEHPDTCVFHFRLTYTRQNEEYLFGLNN